MALAVLFLFFYFTCGKLKSQDMQNSLDSNMLCKILSVFCSAGGMERILKTLLNVGGEVIFQAEYYLGKSYTIFFFSFFSPPLSLESQFLVLKAQISYHYHNGSKCFKDPLTS